MLNYLVPHCSLFKDPLHTTYIMMEVIKQVISLSMEKQSFVDMNHVYGVLGMYLIFKCK